MCLGLASYIISPNSSCPWSSAFLLSRVSSPAHLTSRFNEPRPAVCVCVFTRQCLLARCVSINQHQIPPHICRCGVASYFVRESQLQDKQSHILAARTLTLIKRDGTGILGKGIVSPSFLAKGIAGSARGQRVIRDTCSVWYTNTTRNENILLPQNTGRSECIFPSYRPIPQQHGAIVRKFHKSNRNRPPVSI